MSELEKKLKTLEMSGLWNVPGKCVLLKKKNCVLSNNVFLMKYLYN